MPFSVYTPLFPSLTVTLHHTNLCPHTAVHTYITNLASALLSTTAKPGALQSAYTSANAGAGAAAAPNPVDATLFQLLFLNGFSNQDILFSAYMKQNPFPGTFADAAAAASLAAGPAGEVVAQVAAAAAAATTAAAPATTTAEAAAAAATTTTTAEPPGDAIIYAGLVAVLKLRMGQVMGSWQA
ncbi:MAG: hypothetical protein LQ346_004933, partial [Caloplaca aetnensis]